MMSLSADFLPCKDNVYIARYIRVYILEKVNLKPNPITYNNILTLISIYVRKENIGRYLV